MEKDIAKRWYLSDFKTFWTFQNSSTGTSSNDKVKNVKQKQKVCRFVIVQHFNSKIPHEIYVLHEITYFSFRSGAFCWKWNWNIFSVQHMKSYLELIITLREKCPNTEVFLLRFSRIWTEYGDLLLTVFWCFQGI